MRLDKVYIDGFKNLKQLEVDFDESKLTSVLIGQNGAGKSNLIEALARIFRHVDLRDLAPRFRYRIQYRIQPRTTKAGQLACVVLSNLPDEHPITVNGEKVSRSEFEKNKSEWFPDLVFGYYSGNGRRLEQIFDKHQTNYYKAIATNDDPAACFEALQARRMFYCRPLHGVFALLTQLVFSNEPTRKLLRDTVKVQDFHSALCLLHEPWYAKGGQAVKLKQAGDFWKAGGPAGKTARLLQEMAFHPFGLVGNAVQDYREKKQDEVQLGVFLKDQSALELLRDEFSDDADMFYALEAMDVSDLIRDFSIWVTRETGDGEEVEYSDLSDGERQLLMVMGLLRVARGKRVLFLLDEPDSYRGAAISLRCALEDLYRHLYYMDHPQEFSALSVGRETEFSMKISPQGLREYLSRTSYLRSIANAKIDFAPKSDPKDMDWLGVNDELYAALSSAVHGASSEWFAGVGSAASLQRSEAKEEKLNSLFVKFAKLSSTFLIAAHRDVFASLGDYDKSLVFEIYAPVERRNLRALLNI